MSGKIENLLAQANAPNAHDTSTASASRLFENAAEAESEFEKLKEKLFELHRWNPDSAFMNFSLYDAEGAEEREKRAVVGDYVKAVLPLSGKDDWVQIVEIYDAPGEVVLTVSPSNNPLVKTDESVISHFFAAGSTNNFCLQKIGAKINFYVIGLNERTNTGQTGNIFETVRNAATANIGCFFGIQKTQWQTFCENFISE